MFPRPYKILYYLVINSILLYSSVLGKVYFQEQFLDGDKWQERWILSEHPSHKWGFFILSAGKHYGHPEECKGVQTFQNDLRYGMSTKFTPFTNKGKPLVIQYTVKNEQKLVCGGTYIKLFNCSLEQTKLHKETPYLLMFGPDQCVPNTYKTHIIFNYKGKYLEKKQEIFHPNDNFTHLYTLIVNPDNTYSVKIDNKDIANGKLKEDWNFLPPEEILDYKTKKPKDWVVDPMMDDPNDVKPSNWTSESETLFIPDDSIEKPDDWMDSLDGEWEPPLIENPDYEGKWKPRRILNPKYKGPWTRPKMKNPEYFDDPELYKFDEICAVGFEIFQSDAGTIFDNILITDDVEFAEEQGWKTWGHWKDAEKKMARTQAGEENGYDNDEL